MDAVNPAAASGNQAYFTAYKEMMQLNADHCRDVADYGVRLLRLEKDIRKIHPIHTIPQSLLISTFLCGLGPRFEQFVQDVLQDQQYVATKEEEIYRVESFNDILVGAIHHERSMLEEEARRIVANPAQDRVEPDTGAGVGTNAEDQVENNTHVVDGNGAQPQIDSAVTAQSQGIERSERTRSPLFVEDTPEPNIKQEEEEDEDDDAMLDHGAADQDAAVQDEDRLHNDGLHVDSAAQHDPTVNNVEQGENVPAGNVPTLEEMLAGPDIWVGPLVLVKEEHTDNVPGPLESVTVQESVQPSVSQEMPTNVVDQAHLEEHARSSTVENSTPSAQQQRTLLGETTNNQAGTCDMHEPHVAGHRREACWDLHPKQARNLVNGQQPTKVLSFRRLTSNVSIDRLQRECEMFGDVVNVRISKTVAEHGRFAGYVQFSNAQDATAALEAWNGKELEGAPIEVVFALRRTVATPAPPTPRPSDMSAEFAGRATLEAVQTPPWPIPYGTQHTDIVPTVMQPPAQSVLPQFASRDNSVLAQRAPRVDPQPPLNQQRMQAEAQSGFPPVIPGQQISSSTARPAVTAGVTPTTDLILLNMPFGVTSDDLFREFSQYGRLMKILPPMAGDANNIARGFAFVRFADVQSAIRARNARDGGQVGDRVVPIRFMTTSARNSDPAMTCIDAHTVDMQTRLERCRAHDTRKKRFRTGHSSQACWLTDIQKTPSHVLAGKVSHDLELEELAPDVTEGDLADLLERYGQTVSLKVLRDPVTKQSYGAARVEFSNVQDAVYAATELHKKKFRGRTLHINYHGVPEEECESECSCWDHYQDGSDEENDVNATSSSTPNVNTPRVISGLSTVPQMQVASHAKDDNVKCTVHLAGPQYHTHARCFLLHPNLRPKTLLNKPATTTLWVGNLAPEVDEYRLRTHFQGFGNIVHLRIDVTKGRRAHKGIIQYVRIEDAQRATEAKFGAVLEGWPILITYAEPEVHQQIQPPRREMHFSPPTGPRAARPQRLMVLPEDSDFVPCDHPVHKGNGQARHTRESCPIMNPEGSRAANIEVERRKRGHDGGGDSDLSKRIRRP